MAQQVRSRSALLFSLMILSMVIWGGTWPSAKVLAPLAAPPVLVFWRFLITAAATAPLLVVYRSSLALSLKGFLLTCVAGLCLIVYNTLFFGGLRTGLAGAGGVIVPAISPLFTFLIVLVARRRRIGGIELFGLLLGLAGGAIILEPWRYTLSQLLTSGNLVFVVAALAWSAVTLSGQIAQRKVPFVVFSFIAYASATLFDLPLALSAGIGSVFKGGLLAWGNLVYLAVVATAFATSVYFVSTTRIGSARTSSFMFVVPTAALLLSWLFVGEVPKIATLCGGALSIAAVYLINRRPGTASDHE